VPRHAAKKNSPVPTLSPKKPVPLAEEKGSFDKEYDEYLSIVKHEKIPLWVKWGEPELRQKRELVGPRDFERGFRQRPIADSDLLFMPAWIDAALDRQMVAPMQIEKGSFWFRLHRDAGVDLAIATIEKEAAFFALVGIATTRDWHRWVMNVEFTRGLTFGQQGHLILECQDRFGYDIVTVESNAYQESMVRHFKEEGTVGRVPIQGYHTGMLSKRDFEVGLPSLAVEFEQERWHIPYGDARTRRMMEPLIEELRAYPTPGGHDDAVIALFLARESRRFAIRIRPRIQAIRI
jgi:hypothetical protein